MKDCTHGATPDRTIALPICAAIMLIEQSEVLPCTNQIPPELKKGLKYLKKKKKETICLTELELIFTYAEALPKGFRESCVTALTK